MNPGRYILAGGLLIGVSGCSLLDAKIVGRIAGTVVNAAIKNAKEETKKDIAEATATMAEEIQQDQVTTGEAAGAGAGAGVGTLILIAIMRAIGEWQKKKNGDQSGQA